MVKLADVRVDSWQIGLTKLTGKKIKDVCGYIANDFGDYVFKLTELEFEDGTTMSFEGEHDSPYLTDYRTMQQPNFNDETFASLYREARIEDGENVEDED